MVSGETRVSSQLLPGKTASHAAQVPVVYRGHASAGTVEHRFLPHPGRILVVVGEDFGADHVASRVYPGQQLFHGRQVHDPLDQQPDGMEPRRLRVRLLSRATRVVGRPPRGRARDAQQDLPRGQLDVDPAGCRWVSVVVLSQKSTKSSRREPCQSWKTDWRTASVVARGESSEESSRSTRRGSPTWAFDDIQR